MPMGDPPEQPWCDALGYTSAQPKTVNCPLIAGLTMTEIDELCDELEMLAARVGMKFVRDPAKIAALFQRAPL